MNPLPQVATWANRVFLFCPVERKGSHCGEGGPSFAITNDQESPKMVNPLSEKRPRGPWHWTGHAAEARHHWLPQTPLPHLAAAAKGSPLPLVESASCNNPAQAAWAVEALLKLTHKHRLETGQRKKAAGRGLSLLKGCQAFKQEPCGQYLGRKQEGLASGDHTRQVCAPHCWSSVLTCAKVMKIHFFQGTSCQKLRGATTTDTTGTVETCGTVSWVQSL